MGHKRRWSEKKPGEKIQTHAKFWKLLQGGRKRSATKYIPYHQQYKDVIYSIFKERGLQRP